MLINDYSQQDLVNNSSTNISFSEILTAGIIFIVPIIFLLVISAN